MTTEFLKVSCYFQEKLLPCLKDPHMLKFAAKLILKFYQFRAPFYDGAARVIKQIVKEIFFLRIGNGNLLPY